MKALVALLLLFTVLISYGQTLKMYFLIDDNALIYKLQHVNDPLGFFGAGPIGAGPYRHIVNQFVPFYPIFKTSPEPYFFVGMLLYFLTSLFVYWFAYKIMKNKKIALLSAIIFAAGYIGSETMFGIVNSWQTCRGVIMALLSFYWYFKFLETRKLRFYLFSLIVFYLTLDTVYIRAHGLIFVIIIFDLLFAPFKFKIQSILSTVARLAPFAYAHYSIYLTSLAYAKEFGVFTILRQIFVDGKYYLATIPFQDIGNVFIPDRLSSFIEIAFKNYVRLHPSVDFGSLFAGVFVLALFLFITIKNFKKEKSMTKILFFSFIWTVANFIMFYAREPFHVLWSTHRYLSFSFVGVALFWASVYYLLTKGSLGKIGTLYKIIFAGFVMSLLFFSVKYQSEFNARRSTPAKAFFHSFKQAVPTLKKGDVLYFDIANDNKIAAQFGSFFGGMFSEASNFAIYTEGIDYMNDFLFTYDFDQVLSLLESKELKIDNLYTFYYGQDGLVNTTNEVRSLLVSGDKKTLTNTKFDEKSKTIEINASNAKSVTVSTLSFSLKASLTPVSIPYKYGSAINIENSKRQTIFSYLLSRADYYTKVKATTASFWKEQSSELIVDERLDTSWRGHRGYWDEYFRGKGEKEHLVLDIGNIKNIGAVRWFSVQKPLVPSEYTIYTSLDGKDWSKARDFTRVTALAEDSEVVDTFKPIQARYLKIVFTRTFGNDGPEMSEIEVIESQYVELERKAIDAVSTNPFSRIDSLEEYNMAANYIKKNAKIKVFWKSDADPNWISTNYFELPLNIDGAFHTYKVDLPATGINWQSFKIEGFNFPVSLDIENIEIVTNKYK